LPITPSKRAAEENFPVGSFLLAAAVRAKATAFYRYARAADDIADNPALSPEEKLARLDLLDAALAGKAGGASAEVALALRAALGGTSPLLDHASQLLQAFRRDAVSDHCHDWGDLMAYCRFSAAPVGRFLLDLHGEAATTHAPGDALCAALQVLNHLQDCCDDYEKLGRVYVPRDWLLGVGLTDRVFEGGFTSPPLRFVLDRMLNGVDGLLELAAPLPALVRDRRLRLEVSVIMTVAERLAALLRVRDPLAVRVALGPLGYAGAFGRGIVRGLRA
jgi:squalene synthase HpnC